MTPIYPLRTAAMIAEYSVKLHAEDYEGDPVGFALLLGVKSLADATASLENTWRSVESDPRSTIDQRRIPRDQFLSMFRELEQAASRLAQHRRGLSLDQLGRNVGLAHAVVKA